MRIEAEKLFEEKREKESMIVELKNERDFAVTVRNFKELEEELKDAKILELEESLSIAREKEKEMENKNGELLKENKRVQVQFQFQLQILTDEMERKSRAFTDTNKELEGIRCELDEEKIKVEKLKLQVAELGEMRSEKEKLNEKNNKLERHVDILVMVQGGLQSTSSLVEAQQKCCDMDILKQKLVYLEKNVAKSDRVRAWQDGISAAVTVSVAALTAYVSKHF